MNKEQMQKLLTKKQERLELYYEKEKTMLEGGVQSYGIGNRNLTRYNTDLNSVKYTIQTLEDDVRDLQNRLNGSSPRKSVGVIPRDW